MSAQATALITGGTSGLGLQAAAEIAANAAWSVLITGTDRERTRAAAGRMGAELWRESEELCSLQPAPGTR
jgi:NAD(P)-dependent dehydrogenase (short-subunit alcohol dehydrogenase family)